MYEHFGNKILYQVESRDHYMVLDVWMYCLLIYCKRKILLNC
jgi:hypothetical protein